MGLERQNPGQNGRRVTKAYEAWKWEENSVSSNAYDIYGIFEVWLVPAEDRRCSCIILFIDFVDKTPNSN